MYNLDEFYKKIPKAWYDDITEYTFTTELSQTHLYLLHSLALELIDFVFTHKSNVRLIYSKDLNDIGFEYFICPKPSGEYVSIDFQMDENQELIFDNLGSKTGMSLLLEKIINNSIINQYLFLVRVAFQLVC